MDLKPFLIAGVDEVGRGPLAGSVVAAAVILNPAKRIDGLLDSKLLNEATRELLDVEIRAHALSFCIAEASVEEIDTINILHASMLAMQRAVEGLSITPDLALIDGNRCPEVTCASSAIVKGDQRVQSISAASIIAKVFRDHQMMELHEIHPEYGFASHKGYPTAQHRQALIDYGVIDLHRRSFKPVKEALARARSSVGAPF
ncbi:MAG: ribonuclease HII [Granulosicoccus sp.]|jgi:ribonuclease HII